MNGDLVRKDGISSLFCRQRSSGLPTLHQVPLIFVEMFRFQKTLLGGTGTSQEQSMAMSSFREGTSLARASICEGGPTPNARGVTFFSFTGVRAWENPSHRVSALRSFFPIYILDCCDLST